MTATVLALPQDCSLPDWLSSCLIEHGAKPENTEVIAALESAAEGSPSI